MINKDLDVKCECGCYLYVKEAYVNDFDHKQEVIVTEHKCVQVEQELLKKIKGMEETINMYRTKIDNFKEFAKIVKGIR